MARSSPIRASTVRFRLPRSRMTMTIFRRASARPALFRRPPAAPQRPPPRQPAEQYQQGPAQGAPYGAPPTTGTVRPHTVMSLPPEEQPDTDKPELDPKFKRQIVPFQTTEPAGTIVIDTAH